MEPLDDPEKVWGRLFSLRMRQLDEIEADINSKKADDQTVRRLAAIANDLRGNRTWAGADRRKLCGFGRMVDRLVDVTAGLGPKYGVDSSEMIFTKHQRDTVDSPDIAAIEVEILSFLSHCSRIAKLNPKDAQPPVSGRMVASPPAVVGEAVGTPDEGQLDVALFRIIGCISHGVSDELTKRAAAIVVDGNLSLEEKLEEFGKCFPIIRSSGITAEKLGSVFEVSKQRVAQTKWWGRYRKGQSNELIERRADESRRRGECYLKDVDDDD